MPLAARSLTIEGGAEIARAPHGGVAERGERHSRSRLVSASAAPHFEFVHGKSGVKTGIDRLYRSKRSWFTPAAFKRRDGFDVVVFEASA
jgi:hypothetical protein